MDRKRLVEDYERQRRELLSLLNEWDPIGVVGDGSPDDEYECLVDPILARLRDDADSRRISDFLEVELPAHFGISAGDTGVVANRIVSWFRGLPPPEPNEPEPEANTLQGREAFAFVGGLFVLLAAALLARGSARVVIGVVAAAALAAIVSIGTVVYRVSRRTDHGMVTSFFRALWYLLKQLVSLP